MQVYYGGKEFKSACKAPVDGSRHIEQAIGMVTLWEQETLKKNKGHLSMKNILLWKFNLLPLNKGRTSFTV